jgi:sulfofructose kinase
LTDAAAKRPKILCSGIAVQDIVMRVESFPAAGMKVAASDFIITGGGCAANAAVTIARLNCRVGFAGPLGGPEDAVSDRIVSNLTKEGIDCSGVARVSGGVASVSLILLDASGEKTIATRRGVNLGSTRPENATTLVADADAVLVDNRFPHFVFDVCRAAQARRIPVVIDLDQETKVDDPLLALGTHVISSTEALFATTGYNDYGDALRKLAGSVSGFLAITDGPKGVYWLERGELRHMPAFRIKVVDSLGAGDAFHGGFTVALAEGRPLPEILRFASAAAALKCTKFGGGSGAPTRAEVEAFLSQNS